MKSKFLIIIGIVVFIAVLIPLNFSIVKDDQSYVLFCTHYVFSNFRTCSVLWHEVEAIGDGNYDSSFKPEPSEYEQIQPIDENKQFQNIMEKKAILVFNIKLDEYRYSVDQLTVQEGYRTSQDHEFFMAEAVTTNGTRYFLMTTFESEQAMDTIDVEIFEIISDKCTRNDVLNASGCNPKYLGEAQKNTSVGMWEH